MFPMHVRPVPAPAETKLRLPLDLERNGWLPEDVQSPDPAMKKK